MSYYEPISVASDEGIAETYAETGHEHQLFSAGEDVRFDGNYQGSLKVYKAADWCLVEGRVSSSGLVASSVVGVLPLGFRPAFRHSYLTQGVSSAGIGYLIAFIDIYPNGNIEAPDYAITPDTVTDLILNALLFRRN